MPILSVRLFFSLLFLCRNCITLYAGPGRWVSFRKRCILFFLFLFLVLAILRFFLVFIFFSFRRPNDTSIPWTPRTLS